MITKEEYEDLLNHLDVWTHCKLEDEDLNRNQVTFLFDLIENADISS